MISEPLARFLADDDPNKWWRLQSGDMQNLFDDALDRIGELEAVLRYIARPTMALPGGRDPAEFARGEARENDVRVALATCIQMAQQVLGQERADESGPT